MKALVFDTLGILFGLWEILFDIKALIFGFSCTFIYDGLIFLRAAVLFRLFMALPCLGTFSSFLGWEC